MHTVRIEHPVADFAKWKLTFDADPAKRQQSGVHRYRICRATDDPKFVAVDLDFDDSASAEAFVSRMRSLWQQVDGTLIVGPRARIFETVEESDD